MDCSPKKRKAVLPDEISARRLYCGNTENPLWQGLLDIKRRVGNCIKITYSLWLRRKDLNQRPPGYRSAPVAVAWSSRALKRPISLLWATPLEKTIINRFFFANPTSHARRSHNLSIGTVIPLLKIGNTASFQMPYFQFLVAEEGLEPTTSGL